MFFLRSLLTIISILRFFEHFQNDSLSDFNFLKIFKFLRNLTQTSLIKNKVKEFIALKVQMKFIF